MLKYILFFLSLSVVIQFDHFFNQNNRILSSSLILSFSLIYLVYRTALNKSLYTGSMYLVLLSFLLPSLYLGAWILTADTNLLMTTYFTLMPPLLVMAVIIDGIPRVKEKDKIFILEQTINVAIIALIFECYLRFRYPTLSLPENINIPQLEDQLKNINYINFFSGGFYAFKSSSIMFFDSNYVGIFGLLILSLLFHMKSVFFNGVKKFNFRIVLVVFLVILSLSRASIITAVIIITIELYFFSTKHKKLYTYIYLGFLSFFAIVLLFNLVEYVLNDSSFLFKIDTLRSLYKVMDVDFWELIFGHGFVNGATFFSHEPGAYAHAAIPLLLGTLGILGIILFYGMTLFYLKAIGRGGLYFFLIILVNGFSILDPWQVLIFWGLAYMHAVQKRPYSFGWNIVPCESISQSKSKLRA